LIDESRKQREQAKNALEAFIYYARNKVSMDYEDVEVGHLNGARLRTHPVDVCPWQGS
jgi:hypothetical protein